MPNYRLHAVNFPKNVFLTLEKSRAYYLKNFEPAIDHTSEMPHFFRITTIYTKEFLKRNGYINYVTKKIGMGIELILAYKTSKPKTLKQKRKSPKK